MGAKKTLAAIMENGNSSHLTKEEIAKREEEEIQAPSDNIQAPEYLSDELREKFDKIANMLLEINIISNLDCDALARYVAAEHEYEKLTKALISFESISNRYKEYQKMQSEWFKQARASANDLGLTVTSRCKLVVPKTSNNESEESEEEKLFGASL